MGFHESFTFKIPMSITIRVSCLQLELGLVFFISIIMHYGGDYFTLKFFFFEIVLMVYSCLPANLRCKLWTVSSSTCLLSTPSKPRCLFLDHLSFIFSLFNLLPGFGLSCAMYPVIGLEAFYRNHFSNSRCMRVPDNLSS